MQAHDESVSPQSGRSAVATTRGLTWWNAVLLAASLTAIGAVADMRINHGLGVIFQVTYGLGCLAAVCAVRRCDLFGQMVQPPLILACVAPPVVLLWSTASVGGDLLSHLIAVGAPVVNNFLPAVATTVLTVTVGLLRMILGRTTR